MAASTSSVVAFGWSMADLRAQLMAGEEVGVQALNLLQQALWQMGANPTDPNRNVRGNKW